MMNLRIKITILQRTYKSYSAMKRYLTPAIVLLGFFVIIYAILASTDRSAGIAIGNFIVCMTMCWSTFELPEESLSDISIVKFILFAVLAAAAGYFVRRMIAAK